MEIDASGSEKSLSFCCLKIDNKFCVSRLTREGSGSLLLQMKKQFDEHIIDEGFFGQEINMTNFNLARMNMFLHNVNYNDFSIKRGDTLLNPLHNDEKPFDAIVSNPPYSIKWIGDADPTLINDVRFAPAGKLARKSS